MFRAAVQTVMNAIYPPQCPLCRELVESEHALCGICWRDTPIISGLVCDLCGVPLPGIDDAGVVHCDQCLKTARPWRKGRSALLYRDNARRLVLALKHGDRLEVAHIVRGWMNQAAQDVVDETALIAPVPLHWSRLLKRRYNQSGILACNVAKDFNARFCPDLLVRHQKTKVLDGLNFEERFQTMSGVITAHPKHSALLQGANVVLVDDVMTSGATLSACAQACHAGGAKDICALSLARVGRDA